MNRAKISFKSALTPIIFLIVLVVYGLILRPQFLGQDALPLEITFILAAIITIIQLVWMGHSWIEIQKSIVKKLASAMPAWFIIFSIGILISSWIVSGTIPMWSITELKLSIRLIFISLHSLCLLFFPL